MDYKLSYKNADYVVIVEYLQNYNRSDYPTRIVYEELAEAVNISPKTIKNRLRDIREQEPRTYHLLTRYVNVHDNEIRKLALAWGEAVIEGSFTTTKESQEVYEAAKIFFPSKISPDTVKLDLESSYIRTILINFLYLNRVFNRDKFPAIAKRLNYSLPLEYEQKLQEIEANRKRKKSSVGNPTSGIKK